MQYVVGGVPVLKLLLFLLGLAAGAASATAWLLGESGSVPPGGTASTNDPWQQFRARLNEALAAGNRAGAETENRVRHEFETWRLHPDRPNTSTR